MTNNQPDSMSQYPKTNQTYSLAKLFTKTFNKAERIVIYKQLAYVIHRKKATIKLQEISCPDIGANLKVEPA